MTHEINQAKINRQYLIVTDDGELFAATNIDHDEKRKANNRFIDLLDITEPDQPVAYVDDEWHPIQSWHDVDKKEA